MRITHDNVHVEICCNSVTSAINAKNGGAYRIELCQALGEGGTTPSAAAIAYCANELNLQTRVLIRPRGGDFVYNDAEMQVILHDIELSRQLGAHAVVFGFLTPAGDIDIAKTRQAVEAAKGMSITFHRAFDDCRNPVDALEEIIDCGCHKLLTSGCKPTAMEGASTISQLVCQAQSRIDIIAASGIVPSNAVEIIRLTGVNEIHGSCKTIMNGCSITDTDKVRQLFANIEMQEINTKN